MLLTEIEHEPLSHSEIKTEDVQMVSGFISRSMREPISDTVRRILELKKYFGRQMKRH